MAERTITISSAAKMFNCTGWKIGWACGPADYRRVRRKNSTLSYVAAHRFVPAVARARHRRLRRPGCCGPGATGWRGPDGRSASQCTTAGGTYSTAPTGACWVMTTAPNSVAALPEKVGAAAILMRRRSATPPQDRPHNKPMCGNHLVRFTFLQTRRHLDEARTGACSPSDHYLARRTVGSHHLLSQSFRSPHGGSSAGNVDPKTPAGALRVRPWWGESHSALPLSSRRRLYSLLPCCCAVWRHPTPPSRSPAHSSNPCRRCPPDGDHVTWSTVGVSVDDFDPALKTKTGTASMSASAHDHFRRRFDDDFARCSIATATKL